MESGSFLQLYLFWKKKKKRHFVTETETVQSVNHSTTTPSLEATNKNFMYNYDATEGNKEALLQI